MCRKNGQNSLMQINKAIRTTRPPSRLDIITRWIVKPF
ncbi:hypothetical protein UUU_10790 [Klebsiella pneumoniae subsp. pneumoniae DSM 30104 = JCM 1662 = NBRC 14940]|nr:hypothetical protein UUU_10790 [Klebsiella pneumoniae subsp. pneumoniae DSM 30104 = JCM 1662 = NBRC 14940]